MDDTISSQSPQRKTPQTTFIYVLIDPETNEIRYVGKSNNPKQRLWRHLKKTRENEDCYRTRWINDLKSRDLKPHMEIIEEVPFDQWPERERYWIAYYREQGCHLTNTFEGGIGPGTHTPETRAKIGAAHRGKTGRKMPPFSEEHRYKISLAKKGTKASEETKVKQSEARKGRIVSPETRAKIAEANRGKKRPDVKPNLGKSTPPEVRAKISASLTGKRLSPEAIEKRSAKIRGRHHNPEAITRMIDAKTGKKRGEFSEEWRSKLGDSMRGKKHSPESIEKMREAKRRWHAERKNKEINEQ